MLHELMFNVLFVLLVAILLFQAGVLHIKAQDAMRFYNGLASLMGIGFVAHIATFQHCFGICDLCSIYFVSTALLVIKMARSYYSANV